MGGSAWGLIVQPTCYLRHIWRWRRQEVIVARRREWGARIVSVGAGAQLEAVVEAVSGSDAAVQTLRRIP